MADHADQTSLAAATAAIITARWPSSAPTSGNGNGHVNANGQDAGYGHVHPNGNGNGYGYPNGNGQAHSGYAEWAPPSTPSPAEASVPPDPRAVAAASFFAPVTPDPVPEVFDGGRVPSQRGSDDGFTAFAPTSPAPGAPTSPAIPPLTPPPFSAGGATPRSGLPSRDTGRTQVPPGFERRNFGTFPDDPAEPAPGVSGYGLDGRGEQRGHDPGPRAFEASPWAPEGRADTPPRGFETVAPAALLGTLPPAQPPANPMPVSFAPPEPEPWVDSGWVGWGPSDAERDRPTSGPAAPPVNPPLLPRRIPQIPDVPDFAKFDSDPAPDLLAERSELSRIATYLRDDDDAAPRTEGIDLATVLDAVRAVPGVQDAQLRWNAGAGQTLRIEFTDGADESAVTRRVVRLLRERMGLAAEPASEEGTVDSPFRGRATVGTGRPGGRSAAASAPVPLPRPAGVNAARLVVEDVTVTRLGAEATVAVRLRGPAGEVAGEGRGPGVDAYLSRLAATAAANGIDQVLARLPNPGGVGPRGKVFIEHVSVVPFGIVEVAIVVLVLSYDGRNEQLSGSAIVGDDPQEAVVRATLAALNRRLESLLAV